MFCIPVEACEAPLHHAGIIENEIKLNKYKIETSSDTCLCLCLCLGYDGIKIVTYSILFFFLDES